MEMPKILYKYLPAQYAESMINKGTIRIGTLHVYKKDEVAARQDEDEGVKTSFTEEITFGELDIPEHIKKNKLIAIKGPSSITVQNVIEVVPNSYIYCMSGTKSDEIMKAFNDCDTCVEISNPNFVMNEIYEVMLNMGLILPEAHWSYCDYSGRMFKGGSLNANPYVLKHESYKYQNEVRIILDPVQDLIPPVLIDCPKIIPYLKIV